MTAANTPVANHEATRDVQGQSCPRIEESAQADLLSSAAFESIHLHVGIAALVEEMDAPPRSHERVHRRAREIDSPAPAERYGDRLFTEAVGKAVDNFADHQPMQSSSVRYVQ
jgi:hypothetical protein